MKTLTQRPLALSFMVAMLSVLFLPFMALAYDAGNDAIDRGNVDGYANFTIVDTNNPFAADGAVVKFDYYAKNTNTFRIIIVDGLTVKWVSDEITPVVGVGTHTPTTPVPVEAGWDLAIYSKSSGVIPFDFVGSLPAWESNNAGLPVVDELLSTTGWGLRTYSLNATLDTDIDDDGVSDDVDLCEDTEADADWSEKWGTNRLEVQDNGGILAWWQNKPGKKGVLIPTQVRDLGYTYGCNGHQILEMLEDEFGSVMNGHHKFGLSSSVVEEFHRDMSDGVLDGKYLIDTILVPANDADGVLSSVSLLDAENYTLKVSGTWTNRPNEIVDAKYTTMDAWVNQSDAPLGGYPTDLLELKVDGSTINWGSYNSSHIYEVSYSPVVDGVINLGVYDSYFGDNIGTLTVEIYATI